MSMIDLTKWNPSKIEEHIYRLKGPYVESLREYFSDSKNARFGAEILFNQPIFFVSDDELLNQIDKTPLMDFIGRGQFGSVFRIKWLGNDAVVKICATHNVFKSKTLESRHLILYDVDLNESTSSVEEESPKKWYQLQLNSDEDRCRSESRSRTGSRSDSDSEPDSDIGSVDDETYKGIHSIFEEYHMHRMLRHPSIVSMFVASPHMMVMEDMKMGSLFDIIRNKKKPKTVHTVRRWITQIRKGLVYLHSQGIVHSDIKLENIYVDEFSNAKLGDVGASYFKSYPPNSLVITDQSTPLTLIATIVDPKSFGFETDWYAFGTICICLIAWNVDYFSICNIDWLERKMNAAGDDVHERCAIVKSLLSDSIPTVWDTLTESTLDHELCLFIFSKLTHFVKRAGPECCDPLLLKYICEKECLTRNNTK